MEVLVGRAWWNPPKHLKFDVSQEGTTDHYWVDLACHTDVPTKRSAAKTLRIVQRGLSSITGLRLHSGSGEVDHEPAEREIPAGGEP